MSRWFVLFLIVLLPLRGWCADRMAVSMAVGQLSAHSAGISQFAIPRDCPMMHAADASMANPFEAGVVNEVVYNDQQCQACQLCMSLAPHETQIVKPTTSKSSAVKQGCLDNFASADRAPDEKPPIS
jgi:Pyruvate/2-oxoacid:ferredoxin oxidoreductase delta subunit